MQIIAELSTPVLNPNIPFAANLIRVIQDEMDIMERMFGRTTRTWTSKNKPEWIKEVGAERAGVDLVGVIFTRSTPFVWVEGGTDRGQATFSRDYKPKTQPGKLGSGAGRGRVIKRGRGALQTGGVTARNFRYTIAERRQPQVEKKMNSAVDRGVKKFFVGTKVRRIVI